MASSAARSADRRAREARCRQSNSRACFCTPHVVSGGMGQGTFGRSVAHISSSARQAGSGSGGCASAAGNSTSSNRQTRANSSSRSFGLDARRLEGAQRVRAQGALAREVVAPRLLLQLGGGNLVELGEPRRDPGLDRALPQQPGAERVNGAGERVAPARRARPESARSSSGSVSSTSRVSSVCWNRPRSSAAALRVKVTAAISSIW